MIGCLGLTEPGAGSDAVDINMTKMHRSMKDVILSISLNELEKASNDVNKYEQFVYEQLDVIREMIIGTEGRNFEKRTRQLFVLHVKRSGMIKAIGIKSNYIFVIVQKLNSVTAFVLLAPKNYMVI
jgi:hypothetical protein